MSLNTQTECGMYFTNIMRSFSLPPFTEPSKRRLYEQNNTVTCHIPYISIYQIQEEAFALSGLVNSTGPAYKSEAWRVFKKNTHQK